MGEDTEAVMGGVRMGVNVDIKRTDGKSNNNSNIQSCILQRTSPVPFPLHLAREYSLVESSHRQLIAVAG